MLFFELVDGSVTQSERSQFIAMSGVFGSKRREEEAHIFGLLEIDFIELLIDFSSQMDA